MIQENVLKQYMTTVKAAMDIEESVCLRNGGCNINHKTVQKLMSQMGLEAKQKKRHYHSYKGQIGKSAPNVIDRDFSAERPNQKWTTDVSQVCIKDEKLYISSILDMYNGTQIKDGITSIRNIKRC